MGRHGELSRGSWGGGGGVGEIGRAKTRIGAVVVVGSVAAGRGRGAVTLLRQLTRKSLHWAPRRPATVAAPGVSRLDCDS